MENVSIVGIFGEKNTGKTELANWFYAPNRVIEIYNGVSGIDRTRVKSVVERDAVMVYMSLSPHSVQKFLLSNTDQIWLHVNSPPEDREFIQSKLRFVPSVHPCTTNFICYNKDSN